MSRSGRGSGKKPPDIGLQMECHDEPLTPEQQAAYNKGEQEYKDVTRKLEQMMKNLGAEIIEKSDNVYVMQMNTPAPATPAPANPVAPTRQSASLIAQPAPATNAMVQAIQTPTGPVIIQTTPTIQTRSTVHTRTSAMRGNTAAPVQPANKMNVVSTPSPTPTVPSLRIKPPKPPPPAKPSPPPPSKSGPSTSNRPTEGNSVGGLSTGPGSKPWRPANSSTVAAPVVDLTDDDGKPSSTNVADSREVTFNKLSGKTFPSLVVVARPHLRIKDMAQGIVSQERAALDSKVKSVLMFTPTKFTEWLIQQGLVRSEQYCTTHVMPDSVTSIKLKLGMYSDVSKFPYSGGYVWISECCPQRFVSVFSGSIFEGAPHPPTVLLKLIYHWACQTNVQNVVQWVKVDNFYVKNFFTNMRSVCTSAIHEKYEKMGGLRKRVEVGVISLGTTSQDGNMRQVKVEVLGVMDPESKLIRLRAVEPLQQEGERNYKRRFVKILEPLEQWVDKDSIILTDFTVDKGTLHNMGFSSVYQVSVTDTPAQQNKYSNQNVMEYLRRIVPRMFQNTLSLLSRQIIQQFLDELVWRERWGPVASQAFDNIIAHMAEQTKLETGDSLLTRLSKVAANPFKQWTYASWKTPPTSKTPIITNGTEPEPEPALPPPTGPISSIDMLPQSIRNIEPAPGKRSRKRQANTSEAPEPKKVALTPQLPVCLPEEQLSLESYYYATMEGDAEINKEEVKNTLTIKCCVCSRKFTNNIALMKHLILHAQSENQFAQELSDLTQCKYCLKTFPTPFSMQTHQEMHLKALEGMVCRICEETFRDRANLIIHMHRTHIASELPYECGICKFRSSVHREIIDHFYEVHGGSEKMQCPFCLKTVAFANNGKKISVNVNFFLNHIQKHQRKSIARKCNKCALWFVHKGILKEHQLKDHSSFKDVPGVKPYTSSAGSEIMMPPPPVQDGTQMQTRKRDKQKDLALNYMNKKFEPALAIYGVQSNAVCCECEGDFLCEDHFPGYLTCSRCRFATCCTKAIAEHAVVFHESGKNVQFTAGRTIQLPSDMYCVCGYKTSSGNRLANHLARCERKSAYPSPAAAKAATIQSASFPPLVTLDDADNASEDPSDRWLKAFVPSRKEDAGEGSRDAPDKKQAPQTEGGDPPSMLNILGLVRKPSTDESSLDRAPSDSEGLPDSKQEQPQTDENKPDAASDVPDTPVLAENERDSKATDEKVEETDQVVPMETDDAETEENSQGSEPRALSPAATRSSVQEEVKVPSPVSGENENKDSGIKDSSAQPAEDVAAKPAENSEQPAEEVAPSLSSEEATEVAPSLSSQEATEIAPSLSSQDATEIAPSLSSQDATEIAPSLSSQDTTEIAPSLSSQEVTEIAPSLSSQEATEIAPSLSSQDATEIAPSLSSQEATEDTPSLSSQEAMEVAPTLSREEAMEVAVSSAEENVKPE